MNRLITPALLALAFAGAGAAHAETRNLRGFDSIAAADQIRVEIVVGDAYAVEVTGSDASRVVTEVNGGTLEIRQRSRHWFGNQDLDAIVRVSLPELERISAARGVELVASGVAANHFSVSAAMGADVRISGACRALDASASMGGMIRADGLHCETADVSAAMGGEARVYASQTYEGSASMGGAISISGEGASRGRATAMGGTIND